MTVAAPPARFHRRRPDGRGLRGHHEVAAGGDKLRVKVRSCSSSPDRLRRPGDRGAGFPPAERIRTGRRLNTPGWRRPHRAVAGRPVCPAGPASPTGRDRWEQAAEAAAKQARRVAPEIRLWPAPPFRAPPRLAAGGSRRCTARRAPGFATLPPVMRRRSLVIGPEGAMTTRAG